MYKHWLLLLCISIITQVHAQNFPHLLQIKVVDEHNKPVFGVYVGHLQKTALLTASNMDGECVINNQILSGSDTLQFQGMGYASLKVSVQNLRNNPTVRLKELKYELSEAQAESMSPKHILKVVSEKLKKQKVSRIPVCRYYSPAQYEKITQCRDTAVEYRRELGIYFTSGDVIPYNPWDKTFRSYIVPKYTARSYNLTINGRDTLIPLFLTTDYTRFDIGTRKIFTLLRAVQLYGPLFNGWKYYEIHPIDSDSTNYIFSFKTRTEAYPGNIRISCKGTFTVDRTELYLKSMNFDYIDYQLLRQILLTNQRHTASPFSTQASLTFAKDSNGLNYIRSCYQTTTWKYDLGDNFILIEQPSRDLPGLNQLVEKEAFYCYSYQKMNSGLQNSKTLSQIHLAHRYPSGNYNPDIFKKLPQLLDSEKARQDLNRYMRLEDQFIAHNNKPYYPENYISGSDSDSEEQKNYLKDLNATRTRLFELFNIPAVLSAEPHIPPHPNK